MRRRRVDAARPEMLTRGEIACGRFDTARDPTSPAGLMVPNNVGVQDASTFVLKQLDEDFFSHDA